MDINIDSDVALYLCIAWVLVTLIRAIWGRK